MHIDLSLRDIREGLESNLQVLAEAEMGKYVRYAEIAEDFVYKSKIEAGRKDMDNMNWAVMNIGRALGVMPQDSPKLFPSDSYFNFQSKTYKRLKAAENDLLLWMNEKSSKIGNLFYNHSRKLKMKKDQQRREMIKGIISWQCFFDAYITSLHTEEFAEAFDKIGPFNQKLIEKNSLGYHEQGIVKGNLLDLIKQTMEINPDFRQLSYTIRH